MNKDSLIQFHATFELDETIFHFPEKIFVVQLTTESIWTCTIVFCVAYSTI